MAYFRGTVTPLAKNASWTSQVGLRERHDTLDGIVFADQSGTLHVEQSADGTNWDLDTTTAVSASTGASFTVRLFAPYWRLRYVNGGSDQSVFRVEASTQAGGDS